MTTNKKFDFVGWATKYNIKCADGRTIMNDAFSEMDGKRVPLVWNHQHNSTDSILGHALLKCYPEGVKSFCSFNDTAAGKDAKLIVEHGDVEALSIMAFPIQETNQRHVMHGTIKEVSLVMAGANPGALIIDGMSHSDDGEDSEFAVIYSGEAIELYGDTVQHSEEPQTEEVIEHAEKEEEDTGDVEIADILNSMSERDRAAALALAAAAYEDGKNSTNDSDEDGGDEEMKHNLFEGSADAVIATNKHVLTHKQFEDAINEAQRYNGKLSEAFMAHTAEYGIEDIDWLFPEPKNLNNPPEFVMREQDWVTVVMNGVHHSPFSRIKSQFADITADEARAKGYTKGNRKTEEVFTLLRRETTPTTVYKKQKLDRDDVVDITDFDVVAWIRKEMRLMLNEELARAFLIGDGRSSLSVDKIKEGNIRPVWTDDSFYSYKVQLASTVDTEAKMEAIVRSRKEYKGSGNPVLFTTEDFVTDMLLLKDTTGRIIYDSMEKLLAFLRVSKIVTVPVFEGAYRTVGEGNAATTYDLLGMYLNLNDYNVGADKGGEINSFDDFDIDFNQMKYLIETRCSGALVKYHSAIVFEIERASN